MTIRTIDWPHFELRATCPSGHRDRALAGVLERWSSASEIGSRARLAQSDAVPGLLYGLEQDGLVESRKAPAGKRQWRLTERGAAERRDLAAMSAPKTEE